MLWKANTLITIYKLWTPETLNCTWLSEGWVVLIKGAFWLKAGFIKNLLFHLLLLTFLWKCAIFLQLSSLSKCRTEVLIILDPPEIQGHFWTLFSPIDAERQLNGNNPSLSLFHDITEALNPIQPNKYECMYVCMCVCMDVCMYVCLSFSKSGSIFTLNS